MDRVLFGDNQFFGVNHMSEEKARQQAMRFQDIRAVIDVLDAAYAEGIKTFMCTTHERTAEICDHFRVNRDRYPGYKLYPCLPYAHKYANAAAELGMLGAVRSFLPENNPWSTLLRGGVSLATKDIEGLARLLIGAELKMFAGLDDAGRVPAECHDRFSARSRNERSVSNLRRLRARQPSGRARLHHHECSNVAQSIGQTWNPQSDHLRKHQQDRIQDVRGDAGI